MEFLQSLGVDLPIFQAPMAGVSTPAMAAAVSNAGALGSLGVGAWSAEQARGKIAEFRARSPRSLQVNVFCHPPAKADPRRESDWIAHLAPTFERLGAKPPPVLREIYRSFLEDESMLAAILASRPRVVSFHFGLPPPLTIQALRAAGITLLASATSIAEGRAAVDAGVHGVVAQGYEAGGHRGAFEIDGHDDCLGTLALTRLLVRHLEVPIIAAGGIMDGAGISAVLRLGAVAAQLGTAFIGCPESDADAGFRAALASDAAHHTVMTRAISGRPARCLPNAFTRLGETVAPDKIPAYPIAYDAGKALNAAAKAVGESGFGAQWAGQGAPLARSMPAGDLVALMKSELR